MPCCSYIELFNSLHSSIRLEMSDSLGQLKRQGPETEGPPAIRLKGQKEIAACKFPDGRACRLCKVLDTTPWFLDPERVWMWGYPPHASGKNQGRVCYVCVRIFQARYEARKFTISSLEKALGEQQEIYTEFRVYYDECKNMWTEAGSVELSVNWKACDEKVKTIDFKKVEVVEPVDRYRPAAEYIEEFGDPATNNKGHRRCMFQGFDAVCIPGKLEWKVRKSSGSEVQHQRVRDDGAFQVGTSQLAANFEALSDSLFAAFPRGTGVTLDTLLKERQPLPLGGVVPPPAAAVQVPEKDDEDDQRVCLPGMSLAGLISTSQPSATPAESPLKTGRGGHKSKMKASPNKSLESSAPARAGNASKATHVQVQSAGGGAKLRGRPKRPVMDVATENLKEFRVCQDGQKLFAPAANFRRSLERIKNEFAESLDAEAIERNDETQGISKQFQAMLEISKLWVRKGVWDKEMHKQFKSTAHFLRLHPAAPLPFPSWLLQFALSEDAEVLIKSCPFCFLSLTRYILH